jgi:hypothetical protein
LIMKSLGSLWTMKSSLQSESILLMITFRGMFLTQLCLWHHHLIQGMWLAVSWALSYFSCELWPGSSLAGACNFHHFNRFLHSSIVVFTLCYILMPDMCK